MSKKQLFLYSTILSIAAIFAATIVSYAVRDYTIKKARSLAEIEANKINYITKDNFQALEGFLAMLGKAVVKDNKQQDLKFVHQTFINFANAENSANSLISWSKFDWVDKNNMQKVNAIMGIEKGEMLDMSSREYTRDIRHNPWQLKFASPIIGYPSRLYVIPVGVGVVDENNLYQGLVVVGIDIKKLVANISAQIDEDIGFVFTDSASKVFAFGSNQNLFPDENFSQDFLYKSNQDLINNSFGFLRKNFEFKNYQYVYRGKLDEKYPYSIIVGYNKDKLETKIKDLIFAELLQIFIIFVFAQAFLFCLFFKKIKF